MMHTTMSDEDKMQLPVVDMEERAVLKSSGGPLSDEETLAMDRRIRFKLDCRYGRISNNGIHVPCVH